ncbi:OmpA family protein [Allonocardiopsis opalescens]|uniref:OmpA family protein n=1 Tax=Allonocardiopsis opalescens TaxID=1144618 RepID=UPI001FE99A68|nr:OmpA family protein [Allonocardiopsis opalescens]
MLIPNRPLHTERHRLRTLKVGVALTLTTLVLSSCVSGSEGGADPNGTASPGAPSGEGQSQAIATTSISSLSQPARIEVQALERGGEDMVTLRFEVFNDGDDQLNLQRAFTGDEGSGRRPSDVTLVDTRNAQRYLPLQTDDGECYCNEFEARIDPGQSQEAWVTFPAPPADLDYLTALIPPAAPFFDLPVSEGSGPPEEPAGSLQDPRILDLRFLQDDLSGESSTDQTGDQLSIMLSSDVLFDTNESTLTNRAQEAIAEAAGQIDESGATQVQIDGHTDDTGDDDINDPLSEARAESVEAELSSAVTNDVTFETAGHGSSDPVATNETEEGRQRNRRVTITFERAQAPTSSSPSAAIPSSGTAAPPNTAGPQVNQGELPVLGTSEHEEQAGVNAQVNHFSRSRDGYVALLWTIQNEGTERLNTGAGFRNEVYEYSPDADSGATITDPTAQLRYHPLMDAETGCLCSPDLGRGETNSVEPGQSVVRWSMYRLPAAVASSSIDIEHFGTIEDIAIP